MNFFQHQEQAHKQSRRLLGLFILAVIAIVVAVNAVALLMWGVAGEKVGLETAGQGFWQDNARLILYTTAATLGVIVLGSAWKTSQLRSQGSQVAEALGGTRVPAEGNDLKRQRLRNVVEEVSLASGVPVPAIYVIESEPGINAFAAGFNTEDAAVAVTRGCLDTLSREELQGVIAHEFSHILNGDMRLNLRLMGWLHGILLLALIGEILLRGSFWSGAVHRSRRDNRGGMVVLGLALFIIGYVGVFFARWIKAAVSRQREYLADASAVQFTRHPQGISSALQKIAVHSNGSYLEKSRAEQISHMLFASGLSARMLATHPPLEKRIKAIEPNWEPSQLTEVRELLARQMRETSSQPPSSERDDTGQASALGGSRSAEEMVSQLNDNDPVSAKGWLDAIGEPSVSSLAFASLLRDQLPAGCLDMAHNSTGAQWLMFALLATEDSQGEKRLGRLPDSIQPDRPEECWEEVSGLSKFQRMPLLEIVLATLKEQGSERRKQLASSARSLAAADQTITLFEFAALMRIETELSAEKLKTAPMAGRQRLYRLRETVARLFQLVARAGDDDEVRQQRAWQRAMHSLFDQAAPSRPEPSKDWHTELKDALRQLDSLRASDKRLLLEALIDLVADDGTITLAEAELLRLVAASVHVPLPPLAAHLN